VALKAYGAAARWPEDAPLDAAFWHEVAESIEKSKKKLVGNLLLIRET
jgi:hypothetical protein